MILCPPLPSQSKPLKIPPRSELAGISPFFEAFLLLTIKIICLISSGDAKLKVNYTGCVLFEELIFSMLVCLW